MSRLPLASAVLAQALLFPVAAQDEEARDFVQFVAEDDGKCAARNAKMLLVRSTHATRTVRVWLDRYQMNTGTGDRSRSDLKPGGEAEKLGCSRTLEGPQEWRVARAAFVD